MPDAANPKQTTAQGGLLGLLSKLGGAAETRGLRLPAVFRDPLPVGLDVGYRELRALQVEATHGGRVSVLAAGRRRLAGPALTPEGLLSDAGLEGVRSLFSGGNLRGRQVTVALPGQLCSVKTLRVSQGPDAEMEQSVREQAHQLFPHLTGKITLRTLAAGEVHQRSRASSDPTAQEPAKLCELMAIAAPSERVEAFVQQLHEIGVFPASLDFESAALFRGIERFFSRKEDSREVHVLVDIGERSTQVVIGRGRRMGFYKRINLGDGKLNAAAAGKLGIEADEAAALRRRAGDDCDADRRPISASVRQAVADATRSAIEELCHEVALCLRYWGVTFRGHRPARLCVVGAGSGDKLLVESLGRGLHMEATADRPMDNLERRAMRHLEKGEPVGQWAVATGLALRFAEGPFRAEAGPSRDAQEQADLDERRRAKAEAGGAGVEVIDTDGAADVHLSPKPRAKAAA